MEIELCPNYKGCQIINIKDFVENDQIRDAYISNFCETCQEKWSKCKRYQTKKSLNFCPDFIFPDTDLTLDQIIDIIETQL